MPLLAVNAGSARPVKLLLATITLIGIAGLITGLILTRGLLIYLTFQIIAFVIVLFFVLITGAACGYGLYLLMHRKSPGSTLDETLIAQYVPLSEFANRAGITDERALARIRSGYYTGGLYKGIWYIHKSELGEATTQIQQE